MSDSGVAYFDTLRCTVGAASSLEEGHIAELLVPWPLLASHVTVHSYYHLVVNFN